jgi:AAA+ superfamily predicted ATPase
MNPEYFISMFIFSKMDKLMEYWFLIIPLFLIITLFGRENLKRDVIDLYESYFKKLPKGEIILESNPNERRNSERYQAIMWYVAKQSHPTVYRAQEVYYKQYDWDVDRDIMNHFFRIEQSKEFFVTNEIKGKVHVYEKETNKNQSNNNVIVEELYSIILTSDTLTINQIISFLDNVEKDYQDFLLRNNLKHQMIIECLWNTGKNHFRIIPYKWTSNVSFENKFFENKEKILSQIKFFLENPDYYKRKGIPYQLGILLHGKPGCGKTSFIKAIANYTKRHIVDVKLNNEIELPKLKELILNDKIEQNLLIPQENRIYVFEDIDVMGEIVHKRKNKKEKEKIKNNDSEEDSEFEELSSIDSSSKKDEEKEKEEDKTANTLLKLIATSQENKTIPKNDNNMSYFLNILDGLQENSGRIIIMTTNYVEKIDEAILRPGRIDINCEFKLANNQTILEILSFYWDENLDEIKEKYPQVLKLEDIPHCNIVEKCRANNSLEKTIIDLI